MESYDALRKFHQQRYGAAARGIKWELTFHEWLTWWGGELDRRGVGHDKLMMCRFADRGPYALGNIYRGYPKDNAKTAGNMQRLRNGVLAHAANEASKDAAPTVDSKDLRGMTDDDWELHKMFQPRSSRRMVST